MATETDLILDYVNTREVRPASEAFASPAALASWLEGRGLLPPGARVTRADLGFARDVREAIRQLLLAHNDCAVEEAAPLAVLDVAAKRGRLSARFANGSVRLEPTASGVSGAVGRILVCVADAMADGTWDRLKACRAEDCQWGYLDSAKNHSRAWCSMSSCGNRAKAHAYRERHGPAGS
jgi:predicted RNA-binding Zn ribbon-like protein